MNSNQTINKKDGETNEIIIDSVYIPEIDSKLNEYDVKMAFRNIADVKYVDFVANKYNNKICSAFVYFYKTFNKQDLDRGQIDLGVLLKNTSQPIPRTKKNIHQIASYMDECFQKIAKQDMQIENLLQIVSEQSRLAEVHEYKITQMGKRIEELEQVEPYSYNCEICGQEFLEKKDLYWHSTVCKESEEQDPQPEQIQNIDCEYCGNCFNTTEINEGRCPSCFEDYMDWLHKYASSPNKNVTQQYLNDYLDDPFEDWVYSSEQEEEKEPPNKNVCKESCNKCVEDEWCYHCGKFN